LFNVAPVLRPAFRFSPAFLATLAGLLAVFHALLAVTATSEKSMTADEIAHLTAGHVYNVRGDYRLQPENGNLPQRLSAIPLAISESPLPPASGEPWNTAGVWEYGHTFVYQQGMSADEKLFLGRGVIALVSAALLLVVFFWSRSLFGWRGAFVSGVLMAFCPTFLAHGALATSDVVMTFCFVAAVGSWWRHLRQPGLLWAAISAAALGVALVAKFSAVLLPPMLMLVGAVWIWSEARIAGWRRPVLRVTRSLAVHAVVSWSIIWLFYGFRFSAFAPEFAADATFNHGWGVMLTGIGFPAKVIWWLKELRAFPEAWLYGLTFVLQFSRARGAFMSGEYSITGWVSFFPWAFLIKTTLPFIFLLVAIAFSAIRARRGHTWLRTTEILLPLTPLFVLFAVYWITSLTSNLNIGHRHILPTYPVLFILAGWAGRWFGRATPVAAAVGLVLGGWHIRESFAIRPHYLAYFNQIIGGPSNGWRHLADSSLDWGQDLPGLKKWLDANARGEKVFLAYFGTGSPAYEGIVATALPSLPAAGVQRPWHALEPGVYALGATMLQHVYSEIRGEWTLELEKEYIRARALEPTFLAFAQDPARRGALLREMSAERWREAWKRYETLRFARLCHYLRVRKPEAVIGYSMFIYRLSAAELAAAVAGSTIQWRDAIEQAITHGKVTDQ